MTISGHLQIERNRCVKAERRLIEARELHAESVALVHEIEDELEETDRRIADFFSLSEPDEADRESGIIDAGAIPVLQDRLSEAQEMVLEADNAIRYCQGQHDHTVDMLRDCRQDAADGDIAVLFSDLNLREFRIILDGHEIERIARREIVCGFLAVRFDTFFSHGIGEAWGGEGLPDPDAAIFPVIIDGEVFSESFLVEARRGCGSREPILEIVPIAPGNYPGYVDAALLAGDDEGEGEGQ